MPVPIHARIRVGGHLYGDAAWSVGLNVTNADGGDPFGAAGILQTDTDQLQGWADTVRKLYANQVVQDDVLATIGSQGTVEYIRCSRVGLDGKESTVALVSGLQIVGGGGFRNSAQSAVVASLLSGRPGASYRGRMYVPCLVPSLGTNGRLSQAYCSTLAAGVATWIKDLANALPDDVGTVVNNSHVPVVVSTARNTVSRITTVRVGNRLDSQRSRAEGQKEAYSSAAVTQ